MNASSPKLLMEANTGGRWPRDPRLNLARHGDLALFRFGVGCDRGVLPDFEPLSRRPNRQTRQTRETRGTTSLVPNQNAPNPSSHFSPFSRVLSVSRSPHSCDSCNSWALKAGRGRGKTPCQLLAAGKSPSPTRADDQPRVVALGVDGGRSAAAAAHRTRVHAPPPQPRTGRLLVSEGQRPGNDNTKTMTSPERAKPWRGKCVSSKTAAYNSGPCRGRLGWRSRRS